jgi:phosphatidylethanolamine-binding protein (PEBP) family uncharacterized protein
MSDVPADAKTVALICDDPDAPKKDFTHWVLFNVPPNVGALREHVAAQRSSPTAAVMGRTTSARSDMVAPVRRLATIAIDSPCTLSTRSSVFPRHPRKLMWRPR